jgi:photosystem II stability/assembly factor-like uncharacterized protein
MKKLIIILTAVINISAIYAQSWVSAGMVTDPGVRPSISICSPNIAWVADGGTTTPKIFRTTNGGLNWTVIPTTGITNEIFCVWAMTENTAFVGEGVVNGSAKLLKTTNAGVNWVTILTTDANGGHFTGLAFTKGNGNLFGVAMAERVYRSSNGGLNWIELNPGVNGVSNAQNSLMIIDNNFYGFGLNNGSARIRLTTDNSVTWATQQVNVTGNYTSAIAFHSNKLLGLAATSSSLPALGRTTDGGLTWNSVNVGSGVTGTCYLNWVPNTPVIYILGSNGGIKRSTDNGLTWVTTPTPGVTNLTHFDFYHNGMVVFGYAVSSNGNVIKIADTLNILTGITGNNQMPNSYMLEQNYPNPFNPVTSISFSVPKAGFVKLSVFDALGREVEALVSENKQPGNYEVMWDASGFNSGVYFSRLSAGEFSPTKKMILIK